GTGGAPGTGGSSGTGGAAGAQGTGGATGTGGAGHTGGVGGGTGGSGTGGSGTGGSGTGGSSSTDPCANNAAAVPLPTIPAGTFDVTTYGAMGDGKTDNTKAIQAALTAAVNAGGGTVVVPSGTFLSGPLVIGNSTNLQLASGAVLRMLPMGTYPSPPPVFISTSGTSHDIAITGSGTIDGQGQAWWDAFAADSSTTRPQEVSLGKVTRVQVSGIKLTNSPEEHIWVKGDTDVTITGITISTLAVSGKSPPKNTDGVDVTATGMFFCNNNIADGDDNIAMGGTNLYIGYSTFGVGHGCSIGSITENGVSHLTVDHLTMNGTTSGIRMKSARDRGGMVTDLTYSNVTMTNVPTPISITSYYPTLPTNPTSDTAMAVTATTPYWQNITIKNVTATGATQAGVLWGLPEAKISTVVFDNVKISAASGMEIFHATGVSFTDGSTITPKSGAAVTIYDASVTGITTTNY
ncbi:MAG TPA: glycosyl hydrolase family 28 protein, partial [Jatrophihabitans sp.]|nr:glycosyl hydrolase family 28 protein [Jatrophihabitans sp.]